MESPPSPRRNLRGSGAACFLFVGRGDMAAAPAAAGAGASRGRQSAATAAAWGGWGGRPRPGNILLQLRQGQLTGRGLIRAVQVRGGPEGRGGAGRVGAGRGPGKRPSQAAAVPARYPLAGRGAVLCAARTLSAAVGRWAAAAWEAYESGLSRVGLPGVLMARISRGPSF